MSRFFLICVALCQTMLWTTVALGADETAPATRPTTPPLATRGLILDLDAERGVELEVGAVTTWKNQAPGPATEFIGKRKAGRPTVREHVAAAGGHSTLDFEKQELVNYGEDHFDYLTTGSGYTWFALRREITKARSSFTALNR